MKSPKKTDVLSPGRRFFGLGWHLLLVLILKIVLLAGLWHAFIKPHRVIVDPGTMGERIFGWVSPNQSGETK